MFLYFEEYQIDFISRAFNFFENGSIGKGTSGKGYILDPGFVLTSIIVIDQVGDLNIDKIRVLELPDGEVLKYAFEESFKLQITDPSTCPLSR